jgi:hypothetical protein
MTTILGYEQLPICIHVGGFSNQRGYSSLTPAFRSRDMSGAFQHRATPIAEKVDAHQHFDSHSVTFGGVTGAVGARIVFGTMRP